MPTPSPEVPWTVSRGKQQTVRHVESRGAGSALCGVAVRPLRENEGEGLPVCSRCQPLARLRGYKV